MRKEEMRIRKTIEKRRYEGNKNRHKKLKGRKN